MVVGIDLANASAEEQGVVFMVLVNARNGPDSVQSVERAFAILEAFDEEHPSLSGSAIASATGLARPTAYRLLPTHYSLLCMS